ncbi:H-type lectin domain-containing protein [Psychromarinibacter halotolerans]|uniref:H-type lectin domain-containing protein n=1 Tax=Psychromarinibacter halotolerans TaxID=1775175 RepID=UPI0023D7DE8E|nr:H-type lectin domain-containing protein [Psychromarinibacter halotolerans]MDF0597866.1 H-type lectin domain-containing protein [Psychromarinibacter halotolerans]
MKRLKNHLVGVDQGSVPMFSDFENDGEMWTGDGPRKCSRRITFAEAYQTPPSVHVSISMWDTGADRNQRADISAESISTTGFDLVFRTWGDSRVARIRADWLAIGALHDDDTWDVE